MNHLCNRHPENSSNFLTLRDFPRGATRSFKPLHKTDVRRAPQRRTPSQSRTVPRCLPPIRSYAMPTGPARRPRTVKTRFILSETPWAAPSLYGGNVDSRPIVLKTKLSFLKSGQGAVHIFCEHLSPGDESACHPKPKYLRQMEGNPCDAGATIWRTTGCLRVIS